MTATAMNLAYEEMNFNRDGSIMTEDMIREERLQRGYCTECRGLAQLPVLLYSIKKARFNPLWSSKEPLTVEGKCLNGQCLRCHPELDPKRRSRNRRNTTRQSHSTSVRSSVSAASAADDEMHLRSPEWESNAFFKADSPSHRDRNQDHERPQSADQLITATVHKDQDGATSSMSCPSLGRCSHQDNTISTPTPVNEQAIVHDLHSLISDFLVNDDNFDVVIDILQEAMRGHPELPRVQRFYLSTIWDLGKGNARFRANVMATSTPDDILLCMKHNLDNASIQEQACGALWALAVDQDSRAIIVQAGAMPRVITSIANHRSHENVVRAAMGCIRTLSPEPEARVSIGILDGIKHVCAAMRMHRSVVSIQGDGCAFLSNAAVDLDKQLVALATDEEIEVIVEALAAHRTDPMVTTDACFALKNYTYDERNLRKLMKVPNIVPLLEDVAVFERKIGSRPHAGSLLEHFEACAGEDAALGDQVVKSLEDSCKSGSDDTIAVDGSVDILLEAMTGFPELPRVQEFCLSTMRDRLVLMAENAQ